MRINSMAMLNAFCILETFGNLLCLESLNFHDSSLFCDVENLTLYDLVAMLMSSFNTWSYPHMYCNHSINFFCFMARSSNLVPNIDHVALDFCFKAHSLNLDIFIIPLSISLYLLTSYGV